MHTADGREMRLEPLRGRTGELASLDALVQRIGRGRSAALVVTGEPGVGKSALLDHWLDRPMSPLVVRRMVAAEAEMELAYAGLQFLCSSFMDRAEQLPAPQREALETAFGLRVAAAPSPFLVGLATLGLLTEVAGEGGLVCVVDDAQWLDAASASAIAFVARRLEAERVAIVLAMRTVGDPFVQLPRLTIEGLGDTDARELLRRSLTGTIDAGVREQLIAEARGNPLALRELPRALTPAELAGGFAVAGSMPLERRIERSMVTQLEALPAATQDLLLLAAADPTGDAGLLWRARTELGIGAEHLDIAAEAHALVVGDRVRFRHPLIRSAVYRSATPERRRRVHAALAAATYADRDPDRRAWHRAHATQLPDEDVAAELERCAARARQRGGPAATAAFLERAASLTPSADRRIDRLIAAAEAKHDAGAPGDALRLLDGLLGDTLTPLQSAHAERIRARAAYAQRRDAGAARQLLVAAQRLDGLDPPAARDTYIEALAAAMYGGRLGDPGDVAAVAEAILAATDADTSDRAQDLLLRGQALLAVKGQHAAIPTLRRAVRAYLDQPPDALGLHWVWFASRAAQDLWNADAMRELADRQVQLARAAGLVAVLPMALSLGMVAQTLGGDLDAADASCDEIDALQQAMGHPLPRYGRMFLAAYRGQAAVAERLAREVRADGQARGEGYALSAANFAEAILYNGISRYPEAVEAARRELPFTHELNHAMRTLLELVEAATRTGERALAEQAVGQLAEVTIPLGNDWSLAVLAMARAQLHDGDAAEPLYQEALERFERGRIPIMVGRARLLYGEMLRRQQRRVDARVQLRGAHDVLSACGVTGFAERAARELAATGETLRVRSHPARDQLTEQERNVARLARSGLSNREIGSRLFISARTAEYHLHKVFIKLGITSRAELRSALADADADGVSR
jgi:DNA-binding CsgD family transcriptional regulator